MFGVWKRKPATPDVVIYTKPDCPLCDKAKALLNELQKEFPHNLIEKDVNSEEKARKYYADRVPVILVNSREVAGYPLSPAVELLWLEDGDHDLTPRKSVSGFTAAQHLDTAADAVAAFVKRVAVAG